MTTTHSLILGASAAGLAIAACLQKEGIPYCILEKKSRVAYPWRNHYDRLHLHTSKKRSALPYKDYNDSVPYYPGRLDVVQYLEDYATDFNISPQFNTEVLSVSRDSGHWVTKTKNETYQSRFVIVATGRNHQPKIPVLKGIDSFKGSILHSSQFKNGAAFRGQNVLIVGFGNSAGEQAICLVEHGAKPGFSVRSPVNVIPTEVFGISILELGKLAAFLPARIADKINAPLIKLLIGDITKLGLKKSTCGPMEQIQKQSKIPLLDSGTVKLIRQGQINVYGDILHIEGNTVFFEDNKAQDFDVIILATGYEHNVPRLIDLPRNRLVDLELPIHRQSYFGKDGLYFCGFYVSPKGMLWEIGQEAKKIAADIKIK